jgi:hypothetical protein
MGLYQRLGERRGPNLGSMTQQYDLVDGLTPDFGS